MKTPTITIEKFTGQMRWPRQQWQKAYYWRLVAANGEKLAVSEAYTTAAKRNKTARLLTSAKILGA